MHCLQHATTVLSCYYFELSLGFISHIQLCCLLHLLGLFCTEHEETDLKHWPVTLLSLLSYLWDRVGVHSKFKLSQKYSAIHC